MSDNLLHKTPKQKRAELVALITDVVKELPGMPKGIQLLVKAAVKQIKEEEVEQTLEDIKDFLTDAFAKIEKIQGVEVTEQERDAA